MSKIHLLILRLRETAARTLPLLPSEKKLRLRLARALGYRDGYQDALVESGKQSVIFGLTGYSQRDPMLARGKELRDLVDQLEGGAR